MTPVQQETDRRSGWRASPWTSLIVLALGFFLTMLDVSIVNIAIPDIRDDLGASLSDVLWAVNAYVLVVAVLLITAGRLGDLYGPRRLFLVGVVVFTVFSLVCGLARNPGELIAARAFQGLGAALLLPQTMAMIVSLFPAERRGLALGVWGAVGGVAAVVGPSLGGLLVTALGWEWIFFVNVPVGVAAVVLTLLAVPDVRFDRRHRLDWGGIALASAGLFCLTFPLMEGERFGWAWWTLALLAAAVPAGAAFYAQQRRRQDAEPLVPFALFRDGDYRAMIVVAASVAFGIIGLMLLLTLFFQSALGFSALSAGLALAPPAVISTVLAPFAGRLTDRFDAKAILLAGLLLTAAGMTWTAAIMEVGAAWAAFLPPMVVIGLGNGLLIAPMAAVAMRGMPPQLAGAASGVLNTVRQLGPVTAVTLVGLLVQRRVPGGEAASAAAYAGTLQLGMALPIAAIVVGAVACGPGALRALVAGPRREVP
ncbi:DHA2 family efflux MFS transporter permease subunit [Streptomyces thermolilacinus]|uniref:Multidrug transporter n=1 Tax=Streptomyces thermolilacinus SPC6 TaxID=1306406 RepID=A0A1D3DU53_9ACTN|nr:DHA2 family efflux MFS transporter permease subunit [Streptomyces thermolilacinus]OEJ95855.1 multidrug transporter [Streptomyces thermolilacinus SPC6]